MTLREGRADLHQRLVFEAVWDLIEIGHIATLEKLLVEARDAILHCPHVDCAYCWQVERKEQD